MERFFVSHKIKPADLKVQTLKQSRKAQTIVGKLAQKLLHVSYHVKDVKY